MNKNESKYFNTAVKMDKALLKLLEKKDFEYISIKEICKEAGVNRSTFYLHYENTSDLLKETSDYIIDNFFACFSTVADNISIDYSNSKLEDLMFVTPEYITPYLTYVKENQRIFTGIMLMLTSLPLAGMVILSSLKDRGVDHNEIVMITIALYTKKRTELIFCSFSYTI